MTPFNKKKSVKKFELTRTTVLESQNLLKTGQQLLAEIHNGDNQYLVYKSHSAWISSFFLTILDTGGEFISSTEVLHEISTYLFVCETYGHTSFIDQIATTNKLLGALISYGSKRPQAWQESRQSGAHGVSSSDSVSGVSGVNNGRGIRRGGGHVQQVVVPSV